MNQKTLQIQQTTKQRVPSIINKDTHTRIADNRNNIWSKEKENIVKKHPKWKKKKKNKIKKNDKMVNIHEELTTFSHVSSCFEDRFGVPMT